MVSSALGPGRRSIVDCRAFVLNEHERSLSLESARPCGPDRLDDCGSPDSWPSDRPRLWRAVPVGRRTQRGGRASPRGSGTHSACVPNAVRHAPPAALFVVRAWIAARLVLAQLRKDHRRQLVRNGGRSPWVGRLPGMSSLCERCSGCRPASTVGRDLPATVRRLTGTELRWGWKQSAGRCCGIGSGSP